MKPLRYKSAYFALRDKENDEFRLGTAYHCCGGRLLECTKCHSIMCPNCDAFYKKIDDCCNAGLEAYFEDCGKKQVKRDFQTKKYKRKSKVEITEVGNTL